MAKDGRVIDQERVQAHETFGRVVELEEALRVERGDRRRGRGLERGTDGVRIQPELSVADGLTQLGTQRADALQLATEGSRRRRLKVRVDLRARSIRELEE